MIWIRSQDRKRLVKVEDARILGCSDGCSDIWANNNCNLGKYSTEEKALKVLDMIEKHIDGLEKKYIVKDIGNPDGYEVLDNMYIPNQNGKITRIFQMPQDSEV